MTELSAAVLSFVALMAGSILGYLARQSIARRKAGTLEAELQRKINEAKSQSHFIITEAKKKAGRILERTQEETNRAREETLKTEEFLRKKGNVLAEKELFLEKRGQELNKRVEELREAKELIKSYREEAVTKLERIAGLSREEARKELFDDLEKEYQKEIFERTKKLEREGEERFNSRAKEILAFAIQKCAVSQAQEITATTVVLPNEDIKGRIIGKEGRNIRTLEKLTGTEILIDETPEIAVISGFSPIRRQIARVALERLIKDGRIQPARIEKEVEKAKEEITSQAKTIGEQAVFETGVLGLEPKIIELLGRLSFRTSYGQNVLLHSVEVSHLSGALAAEVKADVGLCKRAGLLHDVGKSVDHQIEGSHVDIGIKILEKFGEKNEVIAAMKSHHGDYEPESLEAVLVQVADQISGARPGARKETLEDYIKKIENLEKIAASFSGVESTYAISAGRELRVFVRPEEVDDIQAQKLAKAIASRIHEELKYPGEIKVTLIREKRIIEYAK